MALSSKKFVAFSGATELEKLDLHTYRANLDSAFSIGSVPNGGYVCSCMYRAGRIHLLEQGQPDLLTGHFEFLSQSGTGPAIITIEELKLSRRFSTLQFTVWQGSLQSEAPWVTPGVSRRVVVAYTTFANLRTFTGITKTTGYEASSEAVPPSVPDFARLEHDSHDSKWKLSEMPDGFESWRSLHNWRFYLPQAGALAPGVLDMWIRTSNGDPITTEALPYVADSFPFNLHMFLVAPPSKSAAAEETDERGTLWFPTVVMNLEIKSPLPEDGVQWLSIRITSKQIKNGRFDLDMVIRNLDGDLIALSQHVALIVNMSKNTGQAQASISPANL